MPNEKKRPSKTAKMAAKLLADSKLLATAKALKEEKESPDVKPAETSINTTVANKQRPNKKRG